jgi:REP element-mobilizing transposase RayT
MNSSPKFMVPWESIDKHGDRLPHWQQGQVVQFVTFRLADSMPKRLLQDWSAERQRWMEMNPLPWADSQALQYHRRFTARFDRWLDQGHGSCIFQSNEHRATLQDVLMKAHPEKAILHAWVIMPNHIHLLVTPKTPISNLIQTWKGVSARRLGRSKLWQPNYFDRMIRDQDHFIAVLRYIRRNGRSVPSDQHTLWENDQVQEVGRFEGR